MQWKQLGALLSRRKDRYLLWLIANLGGLLLAYLAAATILLFHGRVGPFVPGPDVYLITATVSLAVAGVSYHLSVDQSQGFRLSPLLSLSWPFLLMLVYGFLIAMGVAPPIISNEVIWGVVVVVALGCWLWSSIIWLHEQGLLEDSRNEQPPIAGVPEALRQQAEVLPKLGD